MAKFAQAGIALAFLGLAWVGGCSDGNGPMSRAASVTIAPGSATLLVQETVQLSASVRDTTGSVVTGHPIVWSSDNAAVATVDANGLVTALKVGAAGVVATSDGRSDTAAVTVVDAPHDVIVSNPVATGALAATAGAGGAAALMSAASDTVAYVSLAPGTIPSGSRAIVRRAGDAGSLTTAVVDGGFDPVPVRAQAGDLIEIIVTDAGGGTVSVLGVAVARSRPPIVVRTDPPKRKTDVPVNASLVIVFSEPVASSTLTPSSVQLFQGTTPVPGTASLLQGTAAAVVFNAAAGLNPNTDYRLVVSNAVRDLDGDPLVGGAAVDFTTGTGYVGFADHVSVLPDTTTVLVGSQIQFAVAARDSFGTLIVGRPVVWSSDDPAVASVSATGVVTTLAPGQAHVQAQVDGWSTGQALVMVATALVPVDTVSVSPSSTTIPIGASGGAALAAAVTKDAAGNVLSFRQVGWTTSDPAVATVVAASGGRAVITGHSPGSATITATSEGRSDSVTVTAVNPGPFVRISAGDMHGWGGSHTCGVTTDDWLLCWGTNEKGQLGNSTPGSAYAPMGVGGLNFAQVSAGLDFTCGLTPGGAAYCWGGSDWGVLGNGSATAQDECLAGYRCSLTPLAVSGGHQFSTLGVGGMHACALTTTGKVFCWGYNGSGYLGIGTNTGPEICNYGSACSTVPIEVPAGGQVFTDLAVGGNLGYSGEHSCALTVSGAAYCWGSNAYGQLGDSTITDRFSPVPVKGGPPFVSLSVGNGHTCGLTSDSAAYCWGFNGYGELGDGTTAYRTSPVLVTGNHHWSSISTGSYQTCGIATGGVAYCWGDNYWGQLGNSASNGSAIPVLVDGGFSFASVSAGTMHSCGITVTGIAYCWGTNLGAQLGDGTTTDSRVPVKVAGQP